MWCSKYEGKRLKICHLDWSSHFILENYDGCYTFLLLLTLNLSNSYHHKSMIQNLTVFSQLISVHSFLEHGCPIFHIHSLHPLRDRCYMQSEKILQLGNNPLFLSCSPLDSLNNFHKLNLTSSRASHQPSKWRRFKKLINHIHCIILWKAEL